MNTDEPDDDNKVSWYWKAFCVAAILNWFVSPIIDRATGWQTVHHVAEDGGLWRAERCDPESWCAHGLMANIIRGNGK